MITSGPQNKYTKGMHPTFDELFRLYNRQVLTYCLRHVDRLEDAEEIAQDVFVNLWRHIDELREPERVQAYLLVTARNMIINHYRRRIDSEMYADYIRYRESLSGASASAHVEYTEFEAMAKRTILQLPPTQSRVIMMSRFDGLDNKEIAMRLNLSLQTVKNTLSQGLKELKKRMYRLPIYLITSLCIITY